MDDLRLKLLIRFCGIFSIIAGILNIYLSFRNQTLEDGLPWYYRAADISVFIALIGVYISKRQQLGIYGLISMLIIAVALSMLILNRYYAMALSIYTLGLIFLAIIILYTRIFPVWIAWVWILAPIIALPGYILNMSPGIQTILVRIASISFGAGFLGIGYQLIIPT